MKPCDDCEYKGLFGEIVEIVGLESAARLCDLKGGRSVYIPRKPLPPEHWLCQLIGLTAAHQLADRFGGGEVELPFGPAGGARGRAHLLICEMLSQGKSAAEIAAQAGVSARTVRRHKGGYSGPRRRHEARLGASAQERALLDELRREARELAATPQELMAVIKRLLRRVPKHSMDNFLSQLRGGA